MNRRSLLFISLFLAALYLGRPFAWFVQGDVLVQRAGASQAVYDADGSLLDLTLSTDEKYRLWTPLSEISPAMIRATLSQEDSWFYRHPGINPVSLVRSAILTYLHGVRAGGSTITMQLARLRYGMYTRSAFGKVKQMGASLALEALFTKDQILEAYLNLAPYGSNIEGVGAAARIYYGKEAKDLSEAEAVTLSVIPQLPSRRVPRSKIAGSTEDASLVNAKERLLTRLKGSPSNGLIQQVFALKSRKDLPSEAPHLVGRLTRTWPLEPRLHSTLDLSLQHALERQIEQFVQRNDRLGIRNAAAVLVDTATMEVKGYVGSAAYLNNDIQGFVDGIQARRSPGSALKPFVYGMAIQKGLIHPGSILKDTSFTKSTYNPENFERDFVGPISATDALVRSRNIPAVFLLNQLGPGAFYNFLKQAGIGGMREECFYGLSLVLGGVEVRMDELASLYAMLANGGKMQPLKYLRETKTPAPQELMTPEASRLVLEMLAENPKPSSLVDSSHRLNQISVPWKTGTSFSFRDAWSAGIVGQYALVVWVGNFNGRSNPAFIGRDAAGPLFFSIADAIAASTTLTEKWRLGQRRIKKVKICAVSGELPGPNCSHIRSSWFIPGVSPIHTCLVHRKIWIDKARGMRTCAASEKRGLETVFEFWPSDLLSLYASAGLPRAEPPPLASECSGVQSSGSAPLITSPDPHIHYKLQEGHDSVPLHAVTDADSRRSYWFVDDALVGTAQSGETIFWHARPGDFLVRVVDEEGRSNEAALHVE